MPLHLLLFARYFEAPESALLQSMQQLSNLWSARGFEHSMVRGGKARAVGLNLGNALYGVQYLEHPYDEGIGACVLWFR